MPQTAADY